MIHMPSYADLRESGLARGRVELRAEVDERLVEGFPIKRANLVELDPLPRRPVKRLPAKTCSHDYVNLLFHH